MSRSNHSGAQRIAAVKQMETGRRAEDVAREVGGSKHTLYGRVAEEDQEEALGYHSRFCPVFHRGAQRARLDFQVFASQSRFRETHYCHSIFHSFRVAIFFVVGQLEAECRWNRPSINNAFARLRTP